MWRITKILQSICSFLLILTIKFWSNENFFIPLHSQIEILWRIWLQWPPLLFRKCSTLLKNRLAAYMMADENLVSRPIGVEVRLADTLDRSGRYDVLIVLEDGSEKEVKFRDRHSRLVYIYTLLHPQGYQRRSLRTNPTTSKHWETCLADSTSGQQSLWWRP